MQAGSSHIIQEKFAKYYKTCTLSNLPLSLIEKREFGFILLDNKTMLRHKSFKSTDALKDFLVSTVPSNAYYSSAYYERPEAGMDKKGWLGADLVFDIDADHIPTPCDKIHDSWICDNCGFYGKGHSPERCPACGEAKFDSKTWTCEICLKSAKKETAKLVDMLTKDLGFATDEVKMFFSGNRGYHVHVEHKKTLLLDSMARKEIVDYIIGLGLKAELHRLIDNNRISVGSGISGWRDRIVDRINRFLKKASSDEIEKIGLKKSSARLFVKNKKMFLENWKKKEMLNIKHIGLKSWKKIIQLAVEQESAKIDTVVTTDIHRLIRLAGSLHGKTGLMKIEAPPIGFDKFDPLEEAIAFKEGQVIVDVTEAPKFRIGNEYHGPFKNASNVELPTAAAMFLLCRGAAKVVE